MARTTIDIDSSVLRQLKKLARDSGRSLGDVASELLALALHGTQGPEHKLVLKTRRMHARVDIDDKDALYRALDER